MSGRLAAAVPAIGAACVGLLFRLDIDDIRRGQFGGLRRVEQGGFRRVQHAQLTDGFR